MDTRQLMSRLERILDASKAAVLATVDEDGQAHMRWMTPAVLRGREGVLYAVTSPTSAKVAHVKASPQVEWLVQSPSLDEVVSLTGRVNLVDNPSLKSEILELIGRRLSVFWRVNADPSALIVLETVIERASLFEPMSGRREEVELT